MSTRLIHPLLGCDYTSEIPTGVLKAGGIDFVIRYCSRSNWKVMTPGEFGRLKAAKLGVTVVFEDGARNPWSGYQQGQDDAQFALKWAQAMGMPKGRPMTFAADSDTAGHPEATLPYYEGVGSVWTKALCGGYGSKELITMLIDHGFGASFQTYAWSRGEVDTRTKTLQWSNDRALAGYSVDLDYAYFADYGQWNLETVSMDHHYPRYPNVTFTIHKGGHTYHLNEQRVVRQLDSLLKHPAKNAKQIAALRFYVRMLRDRIKTVSTPQGHPKQWHLYWRWWRWQRLNARLTSPSH